MPDSIKDGDSGNTAQVDSKSRLRTYSVVEDEPTYINRVEKQMYSGLFSGSIKGDSGGNYIIYLKNTSSIKDLIIVKIKHRSEDADGSLSFWVNTVGTPGGSLTELTPSNRNAGSNNTADCDFYQSTEITGLSGGRQIGGVFGKDGEEFEFSVPCSGFIIPPNGVFTIKCDNNTTTHYGGMSFYFRDSE